MRRSLCVLLVLLGTAAATTRGRSESLWSVGGLVQGGVSLTALQSKLVALAAGTVGVVVGRRLLAGLGGDYLLSPVFDSSAGTGHRLGMWYGGPVVGYRLPLSKRLDLTPTALFGIGRFKELGDTVSPDRIGVVEPEIDMSYCYSPDAPVALGLGAAYRLVFKSNYFAGSEASGLRGVLFLRGRFF
ncbi:MAG TPA: hypothetical protein VMH22_08695 [bacterium]|nr:hypothetical protein [bacterium]